MFLTINLSTSVLLGGAIATAVLAYLINTIGRSLPNVAKQCTELTNTASKPINSSTTSQSLGTGLTDYLTIKVPKTAINPAKAVSFIQKSALKTTKFTLDRSQAPEQVSALLVQLTSIRGVQNNGAYRIS